MALRTMIAAASFACALACPVNADAASPHGPVLLPPVSPACISSPFGPRVLPNLPQAGTYHYGVDLPAPEGAPVLAVAPGTVVRIQNKGPGGLEMLVQHDGFVGVYSHFGTIMPTFLDGKLTVAAGEKLGVVGKTGLTFGAHLYFAMLQAGAPIDPAPFLHLPQCDGKAHQTVANKLDADGRLLPTRHYFQLIPVEHPYQLSQH